MFGQADTRVTCGGGRTIRITSRHIERVVGSNLLGNVIMRIIPASYVLLR